MRAGNLLKLILLLAAMFTLLVSVSASAVALNPGYLEGTVTVEGYNIDSLLIGAKGIGYSTVGNYDGDTYSLTVEGGIDYEISTKAIMREATSESDYPFTMIFFKPHTIHVPVGATVPNNYDVNPGTVRFQLTITGDSYSTWEANGFAYGGNPSSSYTNSDYSSDDDYDGVWEIPVVPGTEVKLLADVYVDGKMYSLHRWSDFIIEDIAAGDTVVVDLNIAHNSNSGTVEGYVDLANVDSFTKHIIVGGGYNQDLNTNPANYYFDSASAGLQEFRIVSQFENVHTRLTWPYIGGDPQNNTIDVAAGQNYTLDFIEETGRLTGSVNFTGTLQHSTVDPQLYQVYFDGIGSVDQPTNGGKAYGTKYWYDADFGTYRLFLTPGPWRPVKLIASFTNDSTGYRKSSTTQILYYNQEYPEIVAGETKVKNFEYCTGALTLRFKDASGGLLRDPSVVGRVHVRDENNNFLYTLWAGGSARVGYTAVPEVDIHGPESEYLFSSPGAWTEDGNHVSFDSFYESLECGVWKGMDLAGPRLTVESPSAGSITHSETVTVSGTATDDSGVDSIAVNGVNVAFAPTGNPEDPNEVSFTYELPVTNGEESIVVVATSINGDTADNTRSISVDVVDNWMPTVSINSPANGSYFSNMDDQISIDVQAADQGYGYSLIVYLDGVALGTVEGVADNTALTTVDFSTVVGPLSIGNHVVTAVATDVSGNSVTATSTFIVYLAVDITVKPEVQHNVTDGTSSIFIELPDGLTSTASLDVNDNMEITANPVQHPYEVKMSGDNKLILKFHRTPELMADSFYTVKGKYCPNPTDPAECYTWQGSDTTNW